ncbi:MAG TPA: antibiotic biosynthesis monooxygenase, partial [Aestuariivirga sp.]|nr:antibiotic biosynthesis monooxygenase [Aestuariivirga sp.]
MILEHALLQVKPGESAAFERALQEALPLIAASPGFMGLEVRPHCDDRQRYLLLVRW